MKKKNCSKFCMKKVMSCGPELGKSCCRGQYFYKTDQDLGNLLFH